MKSQKFCCELNVRYESMIDDLQDRVKDLKQKQKDAYLLELDLRGKIIDLEKALANKRSAWTEQGLHLANAQKERDHYKERAIFLRDERDEAVRQWERFERMAGDNWAALKAQAGEPVAWQHRQRGLKEYEWQEWQTVGYKPQGPESQTFQMRPLFTHPTTERPYNPLNDYAVIPMNPTEPVKAQAGEPVWTADGEPLESREHLKGE